jgi:sec-independent protein translocase protein TatB
MWTGKARAMVREFQGHVDDMVRESELEEFKKEIEKAAEEPLGQAYEHIVGDDGAMADAFDFGGEEFGDGEKKRGGDDVKPEAAPELPSDSGAGGREPGTPAAAASKD